MDLIPTKVVGNAFQSASGLFIIINPTFVVVLGGLALVRIDYHKWLKFVWPVIISLLILYAIVLSVGVFFPGTIF